MSIIWDQIKQNSKRRGIEFALDRRAFEAIVSSPCVYCGSDPREREIKNGGGSTFLIRAHGVDRIDSSKGYVIGNVATCCWTCNTMKASLSLEEFKAHVRRLAERFGQVNPWA